MLILASGSSARRALLRRAGVPFRAVAPRVRELRGRGRTLRETVLENARRKAAALLRLPKSARGRWKGYGGQAVRILAADTMIRFGGRIYGKPRSRKAAIDLLSRLAGKTHVIATGVVLRDGRRILERYVESRVTIRPLPRGEIARIAGRTDPTRFAGGYAIRKRDPLVARIDGSRTNVIGLPMEVVRPLLRRT